MCKKAENITAISQCSGYSDRARAGLGVFSISECFYKAYLSLGWGLIYWSILLLLSFSGFAVAYSLASIY